MTRARLGLVWLALACGEGAESVDPAEVAAAFRSLHAGIYEVYALPLDRDAVHAHLAERFTGEALTAQYLAHWPTRVRMVEEGTGVFVSGVTHEAVEVLDDVGPDAQGRRRVRVDAAWLVTGVVRHQRHRHPRINRYAAVYTLVEMAEGWRIAETHLRDLRRVATEVAAEDVFAEDEGEDALGLGAAEGFMDPLALFEGGLFDTDVPEPDDVPEVRLPVPAWVEDALETGP